MKHTQEVSTEKLTGFKCKKHGRLNPKETIEITGKGGKKAIYCSRCFQEFLSSVIDEVDKG